jgi:serine/threonine-protein kinase
VESRVGTAFGKYNIIGLLGKGGMGEVYEAYDTDKKRSVALKILADGLADDDTFRTRFQRESQAAATLQEPHVIPIHDWGEIDGRLYIDMRLVQGQTLDELIAAGPLTPARAVAIVGQIGAALDAAHAAGLLHRDIKPHNIVVTSADFAYLVDFGIAETRGDARLTATGVPIGTVNYMAPERFTGQPVTHAVDVYALTCVLYESLTGDSPFSRDSLENMVAAHLASPPPRPSLTNPRVPAGFDAVIARGMAKDPDDRYGTAGALVRAAQRAAGGGDSTPAPPPMRPGASTEGITDRPANGRWRAWRLPAMVAVATASILAVTGVVLGLLTTSDRDVPNSAVPVQTGPPQSPAAAAVTGCRRCAVSRVRLTAAQPRGTCRTHGVRAGHRAPAVRSRGLHRLYGHRRGGGRTGCRRCTTDLDTGVGQGPHHVGRRGHRVRARRLGEDGHHRAAGRCLLKWIRAGSVSEFWAPWA